MATKNSEITWDHVVGTLQQIRALTDALIEVVTAEAGVAVARAALELDSMRKGCPPPPPRGGNCPLPAPRLHCEPPEKLLSKSSRNYAIESLRSAGCPVVAVSKVIPPAESKAGRKGRAR